MPHSPISKEVGGAGVVLRQLVLKRWAGLAESCGSLQEVGGAGIVLQAAAGLTAGRPIVVYGLFVMVWVGFAFE